MFTQLVEIFVQIISAGGYWGVLLLMVGESMILPIPSEGVMPFAGFLIFDGKMTWAGVIFFSTLGSVIGSILSYYLGKHYGRPLIVKYGKFLLLNEHHLALTEKFFGKYGEKTIFVSRFVPVVRHFISIPAGAAEMNLGRFALYTLVGAALWNTFLAYLGFHLGSRWELVQTYSGKLDVLVVVALLAGAAYWFYGRKKKK